MVSSQSDCNIVDNISGKYVLNWTFHFKVLGERNRISQNSKFSIIVIKSIKVEVD